MTITVRLEPEVEIRLLERARAQGVSLDEYLRTVIEQIAATGSGPEVSPDQFEAELDALAEGSDKLPVLPSEACSRENICGEQ